MNNQEPFDTPVLFLIFNRPETTFKVFEEIRNHRPRRLFIAADGPRRHKQGEIEKCESARSVAARVDWPCEVKTLFRDDNLGCGKAVSGAITWFFEHVEEGIILEDDTLPGPGFFRFCSETLQRYRDDERVMAVSGSCLPSRLSKDYKFSYFFSNWDYIWGWGTWRRAWKHYAYEMPNYDLAVREELFDHNYYSVYEKYFMKFAYDNSYYNNDRVTWWSYQWGFARKVNSGLVVVPVHNMILNLGLDSGGTNTVDDANKYSFMKFEEMKFPLSHPDFVMQDRVTDDEIFKAILTTPASRLKSRLRRVLDAVGLGVAYESVRNRVRQR